MVTLSVAWKPAGNSTGFDVTHGHTSLNVTVKKWLPSIWSHTGVRGRFVDPCCLLPQYVKHWTFVRHVTVCIAFALVGDKCCSNTIVLHKMQVFRNNCAICRRGEKLVTIQCGTIVYKDVYLRINSKNCSCSRKLLTATISKVWAR